MATVEDFILRINVQGEGKIKAVSASMNDLKKDVDAFGQVGGPLGNTINGIVGRLGGLATAGLGAAVVFAGLGMRAIQLADALADISDATGISAGSLNNFKNSLIEAGGKADDFSALATKLTQNLGEAATGNEAAQKAFQKLGVFVRDANGNIRDSGTVLQDVIGKLAAISDPATRSAMAVELLGKQAKMIDWTKVNAINDPFKDEQIKQLAKYQEAIDKIGNSISNSLITVFGKLAMAIDEAGKKADEIANKALAREEELNKQGKTSRLPGRQEQFLPLPGTPEQYPPSLGFEREMSKREKLLFAEQQRIKQLEESMKSYRTRAGAPGAREGGGDFGPTPEATLKAIEESKKRIAQSGIDARKFAELKGANDLQAIQVNAAAEIAKAREEIFGKERLSEAQKAAEFAAKKAEIEAKAATDTARYRSQQNAKIYTELESQRQKAADELAAEETRINNIIESTRQISVEQQYQLETQKRKNTSLVETLGMSDREKKNAQEIFALEEERLALLRKIAETKDLPYEERLKREADVNAKIAERKELAKQNQDIDKKNAENFQAGYSTAYKNYIDATRNAAEQASQLFQTFTSSFEDSLVKSFSKGKLLWKEFLLDMVQQLLRSNIQSMLGNFFGSAQGNSNANMLGTILKGLSGFANGGMIPTNAPVLVGERGPEILMGAAGRTVIPNSGIGGSNVTYNINAVDAMSFKAMIASDPTFLYAVSEQGRRRLPGGM
jgi:lambda family phage tail tape measure protein